jgi:fused signal recognition particle receptor
MFRRKQEQPATEPGAAQPAEGEKRKGFIRRLRERLNQGESWLTYDLAHLLPGGKAGEAFIEEMETRLLTGDVGVDATQQIVDGLERKLWRDELGDSRAVLATIRASMLEILGPCEAPLVIPRTFGLSSCSWSVSMARARPPPSARLLESSRMAGFR